METVSANTILQSFFELLRRQMLLGGAVFCVLLTTLIAFIYALPNVYVSTASIAVQAPKVSTSLIPSPITMGTEGRLQVLSQRILNRSRLTQIAEQSGLYSDLIRRRESGPVIVKAVRNDIGLNVRHNSSSSDDTSLTFDVSYRGTDPEKVRQVADTLALFFVEENRKDRQEYVTGTTDFLRSQLKETKDKLEAQEKQVAEYKQRYVEELPEHLAANLATLGQLRAQLETLASSTQAARERREILSQRLAIVSKPVEGMAALGGGSAAGSNSLGRDGFDSGSGGTVLSELEAVKARLAQLLVRFSDKHPDVLQARREIVALEQKLASQGNVPLAPTRPNSSGASSMPANVSPAQMVSAAAESARRTTELTNLQTEFATLELEIQRKNTELARFRKEIALYQERVENAPKRDQELQKLNRDYASTHELYLSLLKRLDGATLAGNLDRSQQGEHFAVVEPAVLPLDPSGPRRRLLSLGAVIIS